MMAAIDVETCVNRFCSYNLGEAITNAIERLNPADKLTVIESISWPKALPGVSQDSVTGLPEQAGTCPARAQQANGVQYHL